MSHRDDPPDYPEPPECCGEIMDTDGHLLSCSICLRKEEIVYDDYDPGPEPELPDNTCRSCGKPTDCMYCSAECCPPCPHGNTVGDCDHCDHLGDIAYDTARENR
jgi:hypothetical protein